MIRFEDQHGAVMKLLPCQHIEMPEVRRHAEFPVSDAENESDRINVMRNCERLDFHAAEFECASGRKKSFTFRQQIRAQSPAACQRGHVSLDAVFVGKHPASLHVVAVFMRHDDCFDVGGVNSARAHAAFELLCRETGVKEDQSLRTMNHAGVAFAPAAEHRDSEFTLNIHE